MCYFVLVFVAGFGMGTLRTVFLTPALGELAGVAVELPIMLIISWWACGFALRKIPLPTEITMRLEMGLLAFLFLLIAEALLSFLIGGINFTQHLALYATTPVQLGLAGQLAYALFPSVRR